MTHQQYTIVIEDGGVSDVPLVARLRPLLKVMLRGFHLRAVDVHETPPLSGTIRQ